MKTIVEILHEKYCEKEYIVNQDEALTLVLIATQAVDARVSVRLIGKRAAVNVFGFMVGADAHIMKLHTLQHHQAPETTSNLLVKSVLHSSSQFFYDGAIRVDPVAQKTDAYQRNENLLASHLARAESKPALEILANDVRCTHGATVGSLSQEELWYLSTRGIGNIPGKQMLIQGFFESAIVKISDTITQSQVRTVLSSFG